MEPSLGFQIRGGRGQIIYFYFCSFLNGTSKFRGAKAPSAPPLTTPLLTVLCNLHCCYSTKKSVPLLNLLTNLLCALRASCTMHCTEMRNGSFISGGFITAIVLNPLERKLAKRTSVQCALETLLSFSDPKKKKYGYKYINLTT